MRRVLFFPNETTLSLRGEYRKIRLHEDGEEDVHQVLKELILGPMELRSGRVLPINAKIRSVILRDRMLYIDFAVDILFPKNRSELTIDDMVAAVKQTVFFNFPRIKEIFVFIDGRLLKSEALAHSSGSDE